jgi:tetratricopeptide (TPR) repeat protein
LRVAARASTFHFKGKNENVRSIGEQLNVASIVEGSIQKNGDDIRITAELIRIADGYRIWTQTYTRKTTDAQAVENDFSRAIASALTQTLAGMPAAGATRHVADPEAHELFLRGRYWWNRRSIADILKAVHYFNQALAHDPVYAQAYLGLADSYSVMGANEQGPPQEVFPKARAAVEKALQLDDSLSEAHATLAQITFYYDGDSPGAEAEFHKAIVLNPSYATAYQWYGLLLLYNGRFDEAVTQFKRAQELDPLSLIITADLGRVYFYAGNYEAARQVAERMLNYDPDFALTHDSLGQVYAWTGKYKEAIDELQRYYALSGHDPDALVLMAQTHALGGQREQALALLRQLQDPKSGYISPYSFASIYACLGDRPQAYEWLEKAFREHAVGLLALAVDPAFRNFRSEPRFQQLLKKVGQASEQ